TLPWPAVDEWAAAVRASPLVAVGDDDPRGERPLRLLDTRLYLDRYWREERRVAVDLEALADGAPPAMGVASGALDRLFATASSDDRQRAGAEAVLSHCFAVIAGG